MGGNNLLREGERGRSVGILLYPISVFLLILVFWRHLEVAAAGCATHTETPVEQSVRPSLQASVGTQGRSAVHVPHAPAAQTWSLPQGTPSAAPAHGFVMSGAQPPRSQ